MKREIPSILITDDDRGFRETLEGVFRPRGFRTLTAGDGLEALEIIRAQEVHLLLVDNHMPRLSGLETLRLIQEFRTDLPCILLSARLDDAVRQQAAEARAFEVLPKPVSRADVTQAVSQALERAYGWKTPNLDSLTSG